MKIAEKTVVAMTYTLEIADPHADYEIVEVVDASEPFYFLYKHSGLPEDFENQLVGLELGDKFDFELDPQKGFGMISDEDFADFELDFFKIEDGKIPEGMLEVGNFLPFTNENGHQVSGRISAVNKESVTVDFNHPLAGKKLKFKGEILLIREATPVEVSHGHVHGEGGVHH
jgi:FKBP-type peptidyl-prolyl cis-trans isomerase SlyD